MIRNLDLKGETLQFEMTNRSIFKIDEEFNNFGEVINGLMFGKNLYTNAIRILVGSCISRSEENKLTVDELIDNLTSEQITQDIIPLAQNLYLEDYRGIKEESSDSKEETKKIDFNKKPFDINELFLLLKHSFITAEKNFLIVHSKK